MEDKVLALVNGAEIKESDIQNTINRFPSDKKAQLSTENGKKQLLNEIIFFELVYNYAKDTNIEKDNLYLRKLEEAKKEILTQTAIAKAMGGVNVTDEEVKDYYEANKNMYKTPEMVNAKHILVDNLEKANEVSKYISEGMSFEEAAQKYSNCPSKAQGGNLGKFSRGQMVPEFEKAAFNLDIGVISEPVKTQFGYHLIKVEEKIEPDLKSFDEVKDAIKRGLLQERQAYMYSKLDSELRNKYKVEIK
ncbi:peptidylprolyl isomerase [Clostridium tyrobutyricum]|jgi:peptidyl-prolyl cis-trans isomerase C|uniref:Foldase protein PrsA n=2 Tax=Clostridium TaxID=1485 RepID=W6N7B8_CLOTY|nr:peptidylprolyl isomerase [Clostridium tyrobutyricum]AND86160.1 peptidylprolyl isomerase [Clostridium tyrobutyricum]MBR9649493.1 peptidylprolyl isomerase [Clostridium tyrobutyricum]MBV4426581.1 peptidylprolyl isomerase [Clostridium tyrobutyricum]MBV4429697.1 peptidylprolyl isomerase [Clostridium tyrobutyricum]MBV4432795.1 peptidylprolyl isomerase [Clostridium tyrobutyricum]